MRQRFEFSASRYLTGILVAAHGLALFSLLSVLPEWAAAAVVLPVAGSLAFYLWRDAWLKLGSSCAGLMPGEEGVLVFLRDGTQLPCRIMKDSLVTPLLTVLNLRPEGRRGRRSIVILPDSLPAEAFRELRVWLKWGAPVDGGGPVRGRPQGLDSP